MIFDAENRFSHDQAITGDAASENLIDLGVAGTPANGNALVRNIGKGETLRVVVSVTDVTTGGALQVDLEQDTTDAFSSATVLASESVTVGSDPGDEIMFYIPDTVTEQYIRLNYTASSVNFKLDAGIVGGYQSNS